MMKLKRNTLIAFLLIIVVGCGRISPEDRLQAVDTTMHKSDTSIYSLKNAAKIDTSDVSFFQNVSYGNMVKMESSTKILEDTKDERIISFAKMLIANHGKLDSSLAKLAKSKGYIVPITLPQSKVEMINKMTTMKLEAQNEYYAKLMVREHDQAIQLFSLASRSLDKDISDFAKHNLSAINSHYRTAVKLDSALFVPKVSQGDDLLKISDRKR